ncbi:protein COBRA-like [Impatiens glandulifera]|uniref:protein COBRA-like n=1 Tax=Impatiens glandulifera TaxID=253017 RepID=UPI001FB059C8|nr:protein COBRA-like [Impatiens glandulifera]
MTINSLLIISFFFIFSCTSFTSTEAYEPLNRDGNITIKWDAIKWTPDGYVAVVTISNFYKYRHIEAPGWLLGWTWRNKEVIWNMIGAQTTKQGNCSRFKGSNNIPHSCEKNPIVVDLLPETPYNQQIANCCKGGVISSPVSDPQNSASSFQLTVGAAGTTNKTVYLPKNFTLKTPPGPGYICGPAKVVRPTRFISSDGRRVTQAMMTWEVICVAYLQVAAEDTRSCCVSLSSDYNNTITPCPTCSCGCQNNKNRHGNCVDHHKSMPLKNNNNSSAPIVQCTDHMCPTQVHWHIVKANEKKYWRVKIKVTNLNYIMNSSQWNLEVVQRPNFDHKLIKISSFNYKKFNFSSRRNSTSVLMMWGVKKKNDVIIGAAGSFDGGKNYVESEVLFKKEKMNLALEKGWGFPIRVYFNGDRCVMPPLDAYPYLQDTITSL